MIKEDIEEKQVLEVVADLFIRRCHNIPPKLIDETKRYFVFNKNGARISILKKDLIAYRKELNEES